MLRLDSAPFTCRKFAASLALGELEPRATATVRLVAEASSSRPELLRWSYCGIVIACMRNNVFYMDCAEICTHGHVYSRCVHRDNSIKIGCQLEHSREDPA